MKKSNLFILVIVSLMLILSSCGNSNDKQIEDEKKEPVTLTFSTFYEEGTEADAYKKIIEKYQALHQDVKINLISGAVNYDQKIKDSLSQGKGPDIIGLQRSSMLDYINQGYIRDISNIIESQGYKEKYFGVSLGYGKYNGKYYGIGDMPNMTVWYYNVDLFKKAGISEPKDLTELIDACNKLKRYTQYPIMIGAKDPWVINTFFGMITAQTEDTDKLSKAFSKVDKQELLNLQGASNAVDILNQLVKSGAIKRDVLDYDYASSVDAFIKGKAAILPMGSWAAERIDKFKTKGFNYRAFENPVLLVQNPNSKYSATAVQVITINEKSKYQKQSEEFIKYLFSEEAQKIFVEENGISGLKSVNAQPDNEMKRMVLRQLESTDENSAMYIDIVSNKVADITSNRLKQLIDGDLKPSEIWPLIINEYIP